MKDFTYVCPFTYPKNIAELYKAAFAGKLYFCGAVVKASSLSGFCAKELQLYIDAYTFEVAKEGA